MPIDRMSTTIDDIVALERNRLIAAADNGADDDVPPEDRPNRRDENGNLYVVAGSNVKFNDDLKFNDDAVCRVLCGARGRDYIAT